MPTSGNNLTSLSTWASDTTFLYSANNPFVTGDVGGYLSITGGAGWNVGVYKITAIFLNFADSSFPGGAQNLVKVTAPDGSTAVFPANTTGASTDGQGTYSATLPNLLLTGTETVTGASNGITAAITTASGGTSPYAYQLRRTLNKEGGSGNGGYTTLGSVPSRTYLDPVGGLNANYVYFYQYTTTDSASNTAYSLIKPGTIPAVLPTPGTIPSTQKVVILNIGDSNTSLTAIPNNTLNVGTRIGYYLQATWGVTQAVVVNKAVGGTGPAQWQSNSAENLLEPALDEALAALAALSGTDKMLVVDLCHGTNYVGLPSDYITLMQAIANRCVARGASLVIPAGSIFLYPPSGGPSGDTENREFLMRQYRTLLATMDNGTTIRVGDQWASYKATGLNPALATNDDNIHLNDTGVEVVAQLRARYIAQILSTTNIPPPSSTIMLILDQETKNTVQKSKDVINALANRTQFIAYDIEDIIGTNNNTFVAALISLMQQLYAFPAEIDALMTDTV